MMDDLTKIPKKQLEQELARREAAEERLAEERKRARAEFLFSKLEPLLEIASEHSRTSCNDSKIVNVERGCLRCFLLDAKSCGWWDSEYELVMYITSPYRS